MLVWVLRFMVSVQLVVVTVGGVFMAGFIVSAGDFDVGDPVAALALIIAIPADEGGEYNGVTDEAGPLEVDRTRAVVASRPVQDPL